MDRDTFLSSICLAINTVLFRLSAPANITSEGNKRHQSMPEVGREGEEGGPEKKYKNSLKRRDKRKK